MVFTRVFSCLVLFAERLPLHKLALPVTMVINTDPSTQQQAIVTVCIVSSIVSCLFVAIRIWTRAFITHSLGWDDCKLAAPPVSLWPYSHT